MTNGVSALEEIIKEKEEEVRDLYNSGKVYEYKSLAFKPSLRGQRNFVAAISRPGHLNLIAEFKRASPSSIKRGEEIRANANPEEIAKLYERCGASAISVLTDSHYFKGNLNDLARVSSTVGIPVLRKDFIINEAQIYESRVFGADAILLIASILEPSQIRKYIAIADSLGMDCLVESHNETELEKAIKGEARIFGINNRDLYTLEVDINTTLRLLEHIPKGYPIVTESGISTYEHVRKLWEESEKRVNAMLVGEAIMSAKLNPKLEDMEKKIDELLGRK